MEYENYSINKILEEIEDEESILQIFIIFECFLEFYGSESRWPGDTDDDEQYVSDINYLQSLCNKFTSTKTHHNINKEFITVNRIF